VDVATDVRFARPAVQEVRRIPRTTDEHLLRDVETLFAFGPCRLCAGQFSVERRQEHLGYHRELLAQYTSQRRQLERLEKEQEERLGARMVCETPGMPAVTAADLRRHAERFDSDGVAEIAEVLGFDLVEAPRARNWRRIEIVQRLHSERVPVDEIAERTGLTLRTVRSYVRSPSPNRMVEPRKMQPRSSKGKTNAPGHPAVWATPKKAALGAWIVHLHEDGLVPMAIADRLGKSDRVVRKYLLEAGVR
jgi:hypothetical protein